MFYTRQIFFFLILLIVQISNAQVCSSKIRLDLEKLTGLSCSEITPAVLDKVEKLTIGRCNAVATRYIALESKDFAGLSNLRELNLCEDFQFIGKVFEPLVNLETLVIFSLSPQHGYPYGVPNIEMFSGLRNLKNLDFEVYWFQQLTKLFEPVQDSLINLRVGIQFSNGLWETSDDTGYFVNLRNLKSLSYRDYLPDNLVGYYPNQKRPAFKFLAGLESLENLSINSVLKFHSDLFEYTKHLKTIDAKKLKVSINNFDSMPNVERLNIEFAGSIQWPEKGKFKNLMQLKFLKISENYISNLTPFSKEDLPPNFQNFMKYVEFRSRVYFKNDVL